MYMCDCMCSMAIFLGVWNCIRIWHSRWLLSLNLAEPVDLYDELVNRKWIQGIAGSSMKSSLKKPQTRLKSQRWFFFTLLLGPWIPVVNVVSCSWSPTSMRKVWISLFPSTDMKSKSGMNKKTIRSIQLSCVYLSNNTFWSLLPIMKQSFWNQKVSFGKHGNVVFWYSRNYIWWIMLV